MSDVEDDDEDAFVPDVNGRVYVHSRCGGQTRVSGGDFTHICDPFWPCTSTYCCQCAGFAPLNQVQWIETGELVSEFRSRVRSKTPGMLKVWRYGMGFLLGGAVGAPIGLLVWRIAQATQNKFDVFALFGAGAGALVCYIVGTIVLNRAFGIDYRRMR